MMRLVQLTDSAGGRRVAVVEDDSRCRLLREVQSIYQLAQSALTRGDKLEMAVAARLGEEFIDYESVHACRSDWRLLPAFDHPVEPARCLVTGTGLTHKASAQNRQAMHAADKPAAMTDSMKMYRWGLESGRPAPGAIGVPPEWFYKGCGTILRAHGEPLEVPAFGLDGGDEAEVAGIYIIDAKGNPRRVGLALSNEFSDHKMEEKNYLYLAPSKLRTCAIGPELIVGAEFKNARGTVKILRQGEIFWSNTFETGEENMSHTVANLEHHHFKYSAHRRPGDVHVHFFGADVFSFGECVMLNDGDVMELELVGFGRPLRNSIKIERGPENLIRVEQL